MSEETNERAAVFIAATAAESELVEQLLDDQSIDFDLRPEAFLGETYGAACRQGILFEVPAAKATFVRTLLRGAGLARGVVEARD